MAFFLIAVLSGALTVLAPCILPLLPVVVGAGEPGVRHLSRRAFTVIVSLSLSVVLFTLLLKATTLLISIPPSFWAWFSGSVMVILGVTLLFPAAWARIPFVGRLARVGNQAVGSGYQKRSVVGDVIMGAALGPVFSTCSPTYLFIVATVLPASFVTGLIYLGGFVLGLAAVLLLIAYFGQQLITLVSARLTTATSIKRFLGTLFILLGLSIIAGWDKQLESKILDSGYGATIFFEEGLIERFAPPVSEDAATVVGERGADAGSTAALQDTPVASIGASAGAATSGALLTEVESSADVSELAEPRVRTAVFGNGCFWCVEHDLAEVSGVIDVVSGYSGGTTENPDYKNYAAGGHREVVLVTYNASQVRYGNLVEHIIKHGDPSDAGGSFKDRGVEYAPAIYFENESERAEAERVIKAVDGARVFDTPLPLPVLPRTAFYPAEGYHQDYAVKNPLRYGYYRAASGRTNFITATWGDDLKRFTYSGSEGSSSVPVVEKSPARFAAYVRPSDEVLWIQLSDISYKVTREDGTERAGSSPLDKEYGAGIYVDIISGEPLFSSRDKYDSGTGWPSFVRPISEGVVTLHEDNTLFSARTEVRSRYADSHLGHVFDDGPSDRGGKRYCMNGAALRFIAKEQMKTEGYGEWLVYVE
ncbi:peptide-methionine (R)-S-oxide reductase MsrB [Patescibacteria group bacterium]|nr:peptide-methionine (R)-S-oxide reductase MsrB [Patescibacteria group bacterium]